VVLVQPPNPMLSDPTTRWPLGLGYLEAVLTEAGAKVVVADLRDKEIDLNLIPKAPIVGITASTGEIGYAKEIARLVKQRNANTLTVIGGAHATYLPDDCKGYFDLVVVGEAEYAIMQLLRRGHPGGIIYASPMPNLDALPFPTRHSFSFSETLFEGAGYGESPPATSIISSRGCPMACSYCREKPDIVRFRSPKNVAEEIREIMDTWGCRHFRFEDDNLTLNKKRALELFELLEPLDVRWRAHTRANLWDDELAQAAKRAGCSEMGFGFEAATDGLLKVVRKAETVPQYREAVRVCKRKGISCKAFWMTSMPSETWETIEDIKRFMIEEKPDKWIVSRLCPYPGSDIWTNPSIYRVKFIDQDFSHYWNFAHIPVIDYGGSSKEELDAHYHHLVSWLSKEFPR